MTHFYSTNDQSLDVSLKEAILTGLARDGGLYMPRSLNPMPDSFFKDIHSMSIRDIAYAVTKHIFQDEIPDEVLKKIVRTAINFEAPLIKLSPSLFILELFHGPTLAFKDFGARFMAQLMGYFAKDLHQDVHILVATSGDTGSAVADGFHNVPGIKVWVLYPQGKVSKIQEQQLTTVGHNVSAIEVSGTFDDCQALVKKAFNDKQLREKIVLSSANSINIGRLIPQIFYYLSAYAQLQAPFSPVVFSVPSGNYGNLTAGLLAEKLGLPVRKFVAASNINDSVPKYLSTGTFTPHPSHQTISNAMDVGNPSNFARMLELFPDGMNKTIFGASFDDKETSQAIFRIHNQYNYVVDPHTAIAFLGLQKYQHTHKDTTGIVLSTAHPAKFLDIVESIIQQKIPLPPQLEHAMKKQKVSIPIENDYAQMVKVLLG